MKMLQSPTQNCDLQKVFRDQDQLPELQRNDTKCKNIIFENPSAHLRSLCTECRRTHCMYVVSEMFQVCCRATAFVVVQV